MKGCLREFWILSVIILTSYRAGGEAGKPQGQEERSPEVQVLLRGTRQAKILKKPSCF